MNRRDLLALGLASLATGTSPPAALAQSKYPERPVRLIVPFAPGGVSDVAGRLWADRIKPLLGTVVVENRASGGGAPGTAEAARAAPDGHTFLFANTSTQVLVPALMKNPLYDPLKDLMGVYILCVAPISIVVHESVPVRSLAELIAYAKANRGKLSYGSAGAGTITNLAGELFKLLIGAPDIVHIPYKGSAPGIVDLTSGHIPMMTPNIGGPLLELHRAGKVRILAVTTGKRLRIAPDIPTAVEAGLPDMIAESFNGLFAPAGVPKAILDKVADATRTVAADPDVQQRLITSGFEPTLESGPEEAQKLVRDELARWTPIMKATDFKLE